MKTVILEYARISPAVLENIIERAFNAFCYWSDIDEDYYEFTVACVDGWQRAELEHMLAEFV